MTINLAIIDDNNYTRPLPYAFAQNIKASKGKNGIKSLEFDLPMTLKAAMALYPAIIGDEVRASWFSERFFIGRVEDIEIKPSGIKVIALGYWRVLDDNLYTALWSSTQPKEWGVITAIDVFNRQPDKYNIDLNGRMYISTKKNQTYTNSADVGSFVLKIPYGSTKKIVGFSCDYTLNLPATGAGWEFGYITWNEGWSGAAVTRIALGAGVAFTRTIHYAVTACDYLELYIYNTTGANNTPAGEDGANFLEVRNIRVVTSTANRVNTTLGTTFGAGGTQTVTPASMSNIYVGQSLEISQGTNISERVTVTAVTSTTFTAVFAGPHNAADTVNAHVVYTDEIVKDILASVSGLATSQAQIVSSTLDIFDLVYEDTRPSAVLNELAARGNSSQQLCEVGIDVEKKLYFRPKGNIAQTYYVDITDIDTIISLENVYNSIYGISRDKHGRKIRSASNVDSNSVNQFGLTRVDFVDANSTSSQQALLQRDTKLADEKNAQAKASITFTRIYNDHGGEEHISKVNPGDIFIIRNYPFSLITTSVIDKIKSFTLLEVNYDVLSGTLAVTPEDFIPTLDLMLRKQGRTIVRSPFIPGF